MNKTLLKEYGVDTAHTTTGATDALYAIQNTYIQMRAKRDAELDQMQDIARDIGTAKLFNIAEEMPDYIKRIMPTINSQRAEKRINKDIEDVIESKGSRWHSRLCSYNTAVVAKRIGWKHSYDYKSTYHKKYDDEWYKCFRQAHVDCVKNTEKRQILQEFVTFKKAYDKIFKEGYKNVKVSGSKKYKLTYAKFSVFTAPTEVPLEIRMSDKPYGLATLYDISEFKLKEIKVTLNSNGTGYSISLIPENKASTFNFTCSSDENGKLYISTKNQSTVFLYGLVDVFNDIKGEIKDIIKQLTIASKTWDYLKSKYSYLLFKNGNF